MLALKRPSPVHRQFSFIQALQGRSKPGGSGMNLCTEVGLDSRDSIWRVCYFIMANTFAAFMSLTKLALSAQLFT